MQIQLKVLTRQTGRIYTQRFVQAEIERSSRARGQDGSALLPFGSVTLKVPAGTVPLSTVVKLQGQHFKVEGVEHIPPYFTRDRIFTTQVNGVFRTAAAVATIITLDGDSISVDGDVLALL